MKGYEGICCAFTARFNDIPGGMRRDLQGCIGAVLAVHMHVLHWSWQGCCSMQHHCSVWLEGPHQGKAPNAEYVRAQLTRCMADVKCVSLTPDAVPDVNPAECWDVLRDILNDGCKGRTGSAGVWRCLWGEEGLAVVSPSPKASAIRACSLLFLLIAASAPSPAK